MKNFIMRWFRKYYLKQSGLERISPNDWIKLSKDNRRKLEIYLTKMFQRNIKIFDIADTNSMDGLMDIGHNAVTTDEFDRAELDVGDLIVYQIYTTKIVHRIVEIKEDKNGRIYRCRGDNNIDTDPYYLRDLHIKYLVLMVIY